MNRFVRNNLILIVAIGSSCVAAVILLVFSVIRYFAMSNCIAEIEKLRKEIISLGGKKPAPVDANREPLIADTKLYSEAGDKLAVYFKPKMRGVAEKFVSMLQETAPKKDGDGKVIKLTVEQFVNDYNEMWNKAENYVDKQFNYQGFRDNRFKNWESAIRKIMPEAQKLTTEPLEADNTVEVLLAALGVPRTMGSNHENMVKYLRNYQAALVKMMTNIKFNTDGSRVDWFGFDPDPTVVTVAQKFTSPRDQFPMITCVWDIFGDVVARMVACKKIIRENNGKSYAWSKEAEEKLKEEKKKYSLHDDKVETFKGLCLRGMMNTAAITNDILNQSLSGESSGPFTVYRMRLQIAGSIAGVRTMIKALDNAYLDHRFYIVRSVALYAERDGGGDILKRRADEERGISADQKEKTADNEQMRLRGRGRGRGRGAFGPPPTLSKQPKVDPAALAAERKLEAEKQRKYAYYERIGYGDVLIGDDKTCTAVIDFDYVVMK